MLEDNELVEFSDLESSNPYYDAALRVATAAHSGQTRWNGEPYITHPVAVAESIPEKYYYARVVALLHDVVEDTPLTCKDLLISGFPSEIVEGVHAITKIKGESYAIYIERCAKHVLSRIVKQADLKHNLRGLKKGSMRDKYMLALEYFKLYEEWVQYD